MAKDPAVLFYTSDFLSGTSFFTDEQRGQYILLLCQQHQLGVIPKNHMINICKSSDSLVISKFMVDANGNYYNKRMREEGEKRAKYCESRGSNKKGHFKNKIILKSYENHMENENDNGNEDVNRDKNNKIFKKPSIEEVMIYCAERKNNVRPDKFFDFYESKGWMIGKNKMINWKAAIRTWEKQDIKLPEEKRWNTL